MLCMETKDGLYFKIEEALMTVYETTALKVGEVYYVRKDPYVDHDLDVDGDVVCLVAARNVELLDDENVGVAHPVVYRDEFYDKVTEVVDTSDSI